MTTEQQPTRALAIEKAGTGIDLGTAPMTYTTLVAISNTDFIPRSLKGNPPAILACILSGRELGLGPMESLQKIDVIDGRPAPSAELLVAMVFKAGHRIFPTELTETSATAKGIRSDGAEYEFTFTWADAQRAGLTGKSNWKNYPGPMLYWRAASQLCRILFPDVLTSFKAYTPEELGSNDWVPPDPRASQEVAEEADPFLPSVEEGEQTQDASPNAFLTGANRADYPVEVVAEAFEPATSSRSEVSDDEGVANFVTILDGEIVDDPEVEAETKWDELLRALSLGAGAGTVKQIEARCRNLCRLMEENGLWPAGSLHSLLSRWVQVEHWSELGNKAAQVKFAQGVATAAEKKVAEVMKEER